MTLKTTKKPTLSIVIPTYNERDNVKQLILDLRKDYPQAEIFIVDDNSPDETWKLVKEISKQDRHLHLVFQEKKRGLGRAYLNGFVQALKKKTDYIVQMDADFSHDVKYIKEMLGAMGEFDMVLGSRYVSGISVKDWNIYRILLSYFANFYARFFTRIDIKDLTGGFKCYKRKVLETINFKAVKSNGYCYQVEMNYMVKKLGFKIGEIPIMFHERNMGSSKMSKVVILEAILKIPFFILKSKINFKK